MIFYLSGTGNSLWAAKTIAKATGERLINILDKERIRTRFSLDEDERVGFCFPVHGWRPPMALRKFISQLSFDDAKPHYCFALCTAGDNIGETINILRSDLASRNIHLDSAFSLIMPESYVGLPFMDIDTPENEKRKKDKAAKDLERFIKIIGKKQKNIEELTVGRWPKINSRVIGGFFTKYMITDKPFHVTTGKCIGCGLCAASCPTGNISLNNQKRPQWHHDGSCLACFSCYHHCPNHAIEYGRMTKNKGQYYFNKEKSKSTDV